MNITAIKQQVKQQHRYSVFVDGRYSFSLSESALLESGLVSGQALTSQQVAAYNQLSNDDKVYSLALRFVALRPRSLWEVESYLTRKQAPPPLSQDILSRLSKLKMLDDEAFATSWVESRRLLKPVSYRRLQLELRQKHVDSEIIERVLAEDTTDELQTLRAIVSRKRQQARYQDDVKLMQYLARQGFRYDDIKAALTGIDETDV